MRTPLTLGFPSVSVNLRTGDMGLNPRKGGVLVSSSLPSQSRTPCRSPSPSPIPFTVLKIATPSPTEGGRPVSRGGVGSGFQGVPDGRVG